MKSDSQPRFGSWALYGACGLFGLSAIAVTQTLMAQEQAAGDRLEEIVVTANRREQAIQDVPYNISVLGAAAIERSGTTDLNSLARIVPGLQNVDTGPNTRGGNSNFSLRGLRFDPPGSGTESFHRASVASVSTYYGETPISFPLMIKDLDRLEVLKGPQGTLYGSGSLAGTVRLLPKRPQFDAFSGNIEARGGITASSHDPNRAIDAVLNVPIAESLALRLVGGYEYLGGFIDDTNLIQRESSNPVSPPVLRVPSDPRSGFVLAPVQKDTNHSDQWFARAALRWRATDAIDVEGTYMNQTTEVADVQASNPSFSGGTYLFDSTAISPNSIINYRPGGTYDNTSERAQPSKNTVNLGSLVVSANLGFSSLTSATSYYDIKSSETAAGTITTQLFNSNGTINLNYYDFFGNYPRGNLTFFANSREQVFTQELRLVSTWDKPVDYVAGAYYQHQQYRSHIQDYEPGYTTYLEAVSGSGLPRPNGDLQYDQPREGFRFSDLAAFGELTGHVTPKWQVTAGLRYFWQDFSINPIAYNYFFDGSGTIDYDVKNKSRVNNHIKKFNTSYALTPDLMLYAIYSEGFRRGGANTAATSGPFATLPSLVAFRPDTSKNYEIGAKGSLLEKRLRYSLAVYLINVKNFQFSSVSGGGFPIILNGDEARSQGAEAETEFQVTRQLSVSLSYAYINVRTRNGFQINDLVAGALITNPADPATAPIATVPSNARLPTVPEHSVGLGVDYSIPFGGTSRVNLHADLNYRGSAPGYIDATSVYYWGMPSVVHLNARAEYLMASRWSAALFTTNLTNDTEFSGAFGAQTVPNPWAGRYLARPRTVGVNVRYSF